MFLGAIASITATVAVSIAAPAFDPAEIRAAERDLIAALEATDTTTWVYHYTEDAVFAASGAPTVMGRTALLEMARTMTPLSNVVMMPERTEGTANLACVYGHASWVYAGKTSHVRLVLLWRKEADGKWRIAQEMQNSPPATEL